MRLTDTRTRQRLISLTPLIDVVFILLLFFMLSTQFTQQRAMTLGVPAENGRIVADDNTILTLRLSVGGGVALENGEIVSVESLPTHAAVRSAILRKMPIHLNADDAAPLQSLVSVTDLLARAGASNVQLTALGNP